MLKFNPVSGTLDYYEKDSITPDADATTKGKLKLTNDLGGTADLPTVPGLATKAPLASPTFTGTVSGITKSMVGLGNVDNTSDADKPVSTATQTALDGKASTSHTHAELHTHANKTALDAVSGTNTGDQDLSGYALLTSPGLLGRYVGINAQTGTTYTPVLSDEGKLVTLTNAAAITVTLPQDSDLAFPIGARTDYAVLGEGKNSNT